MADEMTDVRRVRVLINDDRPTDPDRQVFTDDEIVVFLDLEYGSIKRAAAQALDVIADDEALTSKVIRTQDLQTDGAKVADALRKRAVSLRAQADAADEDEDAGFALVSPVRRPGCGPELTERPQRAWPV